MRFSELDGARVGVWGAGRETASLAAQLARRIPSARIVAIVLDGEAPPDVRERLRAPQARVVGAHEAAEVLGTCDVVVRSPGVSIHRPELLALRAAGVTVTTATGLWLAERAGRGVIGITGTKGKSTTAALTRHLLRAAGVAAELAGNIGSPALDLLDADPQAIAVVELSSYQIADLSDGPEVALVTNLYDEHLDWHGSPTRYRTDKLRLLDLPGVRRSVLNARDEQLRELAPAAPTLWFGDADGWDVTPEAGVALCGEPRLSAAELPLRGAHNALNVCAALTALQAIGVEPPTLPDGLASFRALPHRLAPVHDRGGVTWIDDSISTTPESTLAALASFPDRAIVLIAGGQDRGQDYETLAAELAARAGAPATAVTLIAIPTTGERMLACTAGLLPPARATAAADLREAVTLAAERARPGDVVLLSPAAPSFDSFRDFEERGELFAELARAAAPSTSEGAARR